MTDQDTIDKAAEVIHAAQDATTRSESETAAKDLADAGLLADSMEPCSQLDNQRNLWIKACHRAEAERDAALEERDKERSFVRAHMQACVGLKKERDAAFAEALNALAKIDQVRELAREWEARNPDQWARGGPARGIQASRETHARELRRILDGEAQA